MTYIKKISMTGFKSFGERTVTIRLSSGFTCIVGPNGAGKSNIIDALCFALGRLSKKTMRAKNLEDLIFAGSRGKNPSQRASVTLYFDNSDNIFPGGGDTFDITRTIKKGGGGGYKMNQKKVTRQQILNALAAANIDPDGSNQFVLQGKIVELTHMNTEDRRLFIEELVGLQKYDEMKDSTMKELEKAERDLGQFEAIFKEVSAQLKKVEKEKNDALTWKEFDEKIKLYNAQLIALKISKLREEEAQLELKIEETNKIIEEVNEKIIIQEDVLKQESLVMDNIQKTIIEKENEREAMNEAITQLKTKLSSNQTSLDIAQKSIEKLHQEIKTLENKQMELQEGQTFDSLIEEASAEILEKENNIEDLKKEIEEKQQSQAEFDGKIKDKNEEKSSHEAEISKIKQKISSNNTQITLLKETIQKNKDKKEKLVSELNRIKGDAENIDDAMKLIKKQETEIRSNINGMRAKINEEKNKQIDLESQITQIQEEKNKLNTKLAEMQSFLSSVNTEIKMNMDRIEKLNSQKVSVEKKIQELSKGKDSEEALKELLKEKDSILKDLTELKAKAKEQDSTFRKNEQDLELMVMKQNSIESKIFDNKAKIENLNTRLKINNKELTSLEREKRDIELKVSSLDANLTKSDKELENYNIKKENVQRRIGELSKEKEILLKKIVITEKEYESNTEDISGILQILSMLTQNINISVESIKSNIQQSSAEAIDTSAEDFRKFVLDIIDIIKTMDYLEDEGEKESKATSTTLHSILQTLNLFTNNVDLTIDQLISRVKESADVEIQQSTSTIDTLIQDLMEILENVHLSLRKLTMSKSQELYKQLEEISENINVQTDDLNEIEMKVTELTIQNKHDSESNAISRQRLEVVNKRIQELNDNLNGFNEEIKQRTEQINKKQEDNLKESINSLKTSRESYWEKNAILQSEIEEKQKELDDLKNKLQELKGIENLIDSMMEIEKNVLDLNTKNAEKKDVILNTEKGIAAKQEERKAFDSNMEQFTKSKDKFWENTEELNAQIDEENKKLEETIDRLRSLENIMMIINSIEELTKENEDSENTIKNCLATIEEANTGVEAIQKIVDKIQQEINAFREEKTKELEVQKKAQTSLNILNKDLQKTQKKLNELNKNKEREQQIVIVNQDIEDTEKQVQSTLSEIEGINKDLESENKKKILKQQDLDAHIKEKDESWKKQKGYQKALNELKSDLSMERSKLNNFESKKIITTDQIETFYHRSKDYGALPPVTDELSEAGLQSDIMETNKKKQVLEPVNLKAIEQYDTVKERFDEIDMRRQTIQRERKSILDAIDKIELEKTRTFMKAYHEINREFSRIFQQLSPGGSSKMILDRPDNPFEGGVSIEARPRGKKISSLEILSGGEKTLVALAFIFAVQEFYPAPFYVLDEIDAALDGPNVHRVSTVIKEFASQAQFMVISHREENIVNADRIYGVSMQQSGITDIFNVDLEEEAKRILELPDFPKEVIDN
ncbi:MAG: AAA family ATPase [Candidatus Lokiarchaeota archaeon]|nr:AAA family ATPase [Candidatus Lokiarchaeota archaeon]